MRDLNGRLDGLEIGEGLLDAVEKCRLEVDALPEIAQQIGDREAAGLLEQPPHGERTCRVCDLRLIAGQPPEARLQRAEGHAPGREPHALLGDASGIPPGATDPRPTHRGGPA